MLRIITNSHRNEHSSPLFQKLSILRFEELHYYKIALMMFKVYHKTTPVVFQKLFIRNADIHDHETRQAELYHVPIARTNYMLNAIKVLRYGMNCL